MKRRSIRLQRAYDEHHKFLQSIGYYKPRVPFRNQFPDLSVETASKTSDNLHVNGGFKRTIDDYKWRKDQFEDRATIKAIERKKTRIAPLYNKGPAAYICDGEDLTTMGRKV